MSHTYAILDLSPAADVDDGREVIDMHGIAVRSEGLLRQQRQDKTLESRTGER